MGQGIKESRRVMSNSRMEIKNLHYTRVYDFERIKKEGRKTWTVVCI